MKNLLKRCLKYAAIAAVLLLGACEEAAPPTTAAAPTAPAAPAGEAPTRPGTKPANPASPSVPGGGAGGSGGIGSSPALPSAVANIMFEINAGSAPTRSSSIGSLPPIAGIRQAAVVRSERVRINFPDGFNYDAMEDEAGNTHPWPWQLEAKAPSITQNWLKTGGIVILSTSLNGGKEWHIMEADDRRSHLDARHKWGFRDTGGYVKLELRGNLSLDGPLGYGGAWYACTTTEIGNTDRITRVFRDAYADPSHNIQNYPTMTITGGTTDATAEAIIDNGVITAITVTEGGSGFTNGSSVALAYSWRDFWGEPQRGSGATFTFTVSGGAVTAVTVTNGGSGYRKPCNTQALSVRGYGQPTPDDRLVYTPPDYYADKTDPGYSEVAQMRHSLLNNGVPVLILVTIISP